MRTSLVGKTVPSALSACREFRHQRAAELSGQVTREARSSYPQDQPKKNAVTRSPKAYDTQAAATSPVTFRLGLPVPVACMVILLPSGPSSTERTQNLKSMEMLAVQ